MTVAYLAVTIATIVVNAGMAVAGFAKADFVVGNLRQVGAPTSWLPMLAVLKFLGAAGLTLGLLGVPVLGIAAAAGLVAFFVCAIGAHVRARMFYNIAFPGGYLALAVASLVLALAR